MPATAIALPRASLRVDVLDTLTQFHESIRDVAAWAPSIIDAAGNADPRDARWLRSFLSGPLCWHVDDEQRALAPALRPGRSRWLDVSLEHAREKQRAILDAATALTALLDLLATGAPVSPQHFKRATESFTHATQTSLRYEDDIVLPTARLFLDAADRAALVRTIASADAARPWADVATAGDVPIHHRVHAVRTLHAAGVQVVRSLAACPKRQSIGVEACRGCPHNEQLSIFADGCGDVACAIDATRAPDVPVVGDVMTRDVLCIDADLPLSDAITALCAAGVGGLPVVDSAGRPIGVLSQADIVHTIVADVADIAHDDGTVRVRIVRDVMMHVAFVAHECDAVEHAARLIVFEGIHRLPVVGDAGEVVGIVSSLDLMRSLLARPGALTNASIARHRHM